MIGNSNRMMGKQLNRGVKGLIKEESSNIWDPFL